MHLPSFPLAEAQWPGEKPLHMVSPILQTEPAYMVLRREFDNWGPRIQAVVDRQIKHNDAWRKAVGDINKKMGLPADLGLSCLPKR